MFHFIGAKIKSKIIIPKSKPKANRKLLFDFYFTFMLELNYTMKYKNYFGMRVSEEELKTLEKLKKSFKVEHISKVVHELIRRADETYFV